MDWPTTAPLSSVNQRNKRRTVVNNSNDPEKLDMHFGMLGGALLTPSQITHQMEWDFALQPQREILKQSSPIHRLSKPTREHWDGVGQQPLGEVEYQVRWLRSHHPELDFPHDLLRDELRDGFTHKQGKELGPLLGNRLRAVKLSQDKNKVKDKDEGEDEKETGNGEVSESSCYALYAGGAVGNELHTVNIDQNMHSATREAKKAMMQTEILQVECSPDVRQGLCPVACRSLATLGLFELLARDDSSGDHDIIKLWEMRWSNIYEGPKAIGTDVSLNPFKTGDGLVISDKGSLYRFSTIPHGAAMRHVLKQPPPVFDKCTEGNRFWRTKWGVTEGEAFVAGDKVLAKLDLRSNEVTSLFSIPSNSRAMEVITSFDSLDLNTTCVATTNRVCWFDNRFPKDPFISYEHGRQNDRTISVNTIHIRSEPKTLLSSYLHPAISVYDVRRSARLLNVHGKRLQIHGPPSYLPGTFSSSVHTTPRAGIAYVPRGGCGSDNDSAVDLLELSADGELIVRSLGLIPVHEESATQVSFQDDHQRPQLKPVADRETRPFKLGPFYKGLYAPDLGSEQTQPDAERINSILERMPLVWQTPVHAPLTMCDIVFRAGEERNVARSNFLTGLPLDYDSYNQKCSPHVHGDVGRGAGWTYNLARLISKLNPETMSLSQAEPSQNDFRSLESLSKYCSLHRVVQSPSKEEAKHMAKIIGLWDREMAACKQLALDLALAEPVYSLLKPSAPHVKYCKPEIPPDSTVALTMATEAMSLCAGEQPDIGFGYLKPRFSNVASGQSPDSDDMKDVIPSPEGHGNKGFKLSERLLLSEWQPGTPVDSYTFIDPYDLKNQNWRRYSQKRGPSIGRHLSHVKPNLLQPVTDPSSHPTFVAPSYHRPEAPPVVASSQLPPRNSTTMGNQQDLELPWESRSQVEPGSRFTQTNDMDWSAMPSTQPMPGRHGGRPNLPLPMTKPKRVGGF